MQAIAIAYRKAHRFHASVAFVNATPTGDTAHRLSPTRPETAPHPALHAAD